jgi:succinate dehydrogenase/fumarate reductase flavoprotein subunit
MEQINRRSFVSGAAVAAAAAGAAAVGMAQASGVAHASEADFTEEADVVVIGGGGAGLMACAGAHENGASSILLEKSGFCGGDTALSNQVILGWWPEQQALHDMTDDTAESYLEDWKKSHYISVKGLAGEELGETPFCERLVNEGHNAWQWIADNAGIEWTPSTAISVMMPAPSWDTHPLRRWKAQSPIIDGLVGVMETYDDVTIEYNTEARQLIMDDSGTVVGVRVLKDDDSFADIKANNGVVIATGSYIGNSSMVSKYLGTDYARCVSGGTYLNQGDGLRMAIDAGADLNQIDLGAHTFAATMGTYDVWPVHNHMGKYGQFDDALGLTDPAIYINYEGKRFAPESRGYSCAGKAFLEQPYGICYYVFDSTQPDEELVSYENMILMQGDTLEELAKSMNVPVDTFLDEVERYNGFCESGTDEDFGKYMETATPIATPPFYAIPCITMPYANYGGVKIDIDTHVLNADGEKIPGLYAAGTVTGIYAEQEGLFYCGGVQQGTLYGMIAGENAANKA